MSRHVVGIVDTLLVQEHKLSPADTQRAGKLLSGNFRTFWEPASGSHFCSGGVCISVGPRWVSCIRDHGTLMCGGHSMWVSLQIGDSLIGIMSVYAPNVARASFWSQIVDVLQVVDFWIVGGDLNNIESIDDVRAIIPPHLSSIAPVERDAWDEFLFSLRVSDARWHYDGLAWVLPWPLSDYFCVSLRLQSQKPAVMRRGCRIPDLVVASQSMREQISTLWLSRPDSLEHIDPALLLETCISSSSEICREQFQVDRRFLLERE